MNSKVTLRWQIRDQPLISRAWRERFLQRFGTRVNVRGELVVSSERYRDQPRNLEDCREKLAEMLRQVASAPRVRKKTKPTLGSKRRRLDAKKRQGEKKRLRGRPTMD